MMAIVVLAMHKMGAQVLVTEKQLVMMEKQTMEELVQKIKT